MDGWHFDLTDEANDQRASSLKLPPPVAQAAEQTNDSSAATGRDWMAGMEAAYFDWAPAETAGAAADEGRAR